MQASLRVVGNRDEHAPTDRIGVCFCQHKCRRGAVVCVFGISMPVGEMLSAKVRTRPCGAGFFFARTSRWTQSSLLSICSDNLSHAAPASANRVFLRRLPFKDRRGKHPRSKHHFLYTGLRRTHGYRREFGTAYRCNAS